MTEIINAKTMREVANKYNNERYSPWLSNALNEIESAANAGEYVIEITLPYDEDESRFVSKSLSSRGFTLSSFNKYTYSVEVSWGPVHSEG